MAKAKSSSVVQESFFQRNKVWIIALGIFALFVFILIAWLVGTYNGLVATRENVDAKWGKVETDYQRRSDLAAQLIPVVAAYAKQEKTVLEEVTAARAQVGSVQLTTDDLSNPAKLEAFQKAQESLQGSLSRLIAVAENYPQLKSQENFLALQNQLEGSENRISTSRKDFADAVQMYNTKLLRFPTVIVASMFGFEKRAQFAAAAGAQNAPVITQDQLVA